MSEGGIGAQVAVSGMMYMLEEYYKNIELVDGEADIDYKPFSYIYLGIAIICSLIFLVFYLIPEEGLGVSKLLIISIGVGVVGLFCLISAIYNRGFIKIRKDKIIHRPFFGKLKEINYTEITSAKINRNNEIYLYNNDKKIFKFSIIYCADIFRQVLEEQGIIVSSK